MVLYNRVGSKKKFSKEMVNFKCLMNIQVEMSSSRQWEIQVWKSRAFI